jgi:hypothetical protein
MLAGVLLALASAIPAAVAEDAPKPDAPKPDAPKPDAPKPDAPKPDAPKPDVPADPAEATKAAAEVYKSVYGEEHAKVSASRDKGEKVAFAKKLLQGVELVSDRPYVVKLLRQNAVQFAGADPSGYPVAVEALKGLAEDPVERPKLLPQVAEMQEKMLRTARQDAKPDLATALLETQTQLVKLQTDARDYDAALKTLTSAKGLVRTYLKGNRETLADLEEQEEALRSARTLNTRLARVREVLAKVPNDPVANTELGLHALLTEKNPAEAAPMLSKSSDPAIKKLGEALAAGGDNKLAVADAMRAASTSAKASDYRAALRAEAYAGYQAVLEASPDHPEAARIKLLSAQLAPKSVAAAPDKPDTKNKPKTEPKTEPKAAAKAEPNPGDPPAGYVRVRPYTDPYFPDNGFLIQYGDRFRIVVPDRFLQKTASEETWEGNRVEIWVCERNEYHHILNTNLIKVVRRRR